jgi:hypothetical protein
MPAGPPFGRRTHAAAFGTAQLQFDPRLAQNCGDRGVDLRIAGCRRDLSGAVRSWPRRSPAGSISESGARISARSAQLAARGPPPGRPPQTPARARKLAALGLPWPARRPKGRAALQMAVGKLSHVSAHMGATRMRPLRTWGPTRPRGNRQLARRGMEPGPFAAGAAWSKKA